MKSSNQFSIPYKGIGVGKHKYEFVIDKSFFADYENSNIKDGDFKVIMTLDKKNDHCDLIFDITGYTQTECDRCLSEMTLPIHGHFDIIIKFEEDDYEEENEEVIFMSPDTSTLNVVDMVYEYINLSLPMTKTCDDDPSRECNPDILDRMGIFEDDEEEIEEKNNESGIWDSLKNLNLDS